MKRILAIVITLFLTSCATGNQSSVSTDERGFDVISKDSKSEQRVALVIGNKDYSSLNPLKNPVNDARAMRDILSKKKFNVIYLENASQMEMEESIDKFAYRLKNGNGVGLFYYAGHGMEVDGVNYLIPTDARIPSKKYVKSKSVSTDIIVTAMEEAKNRMNILILDSCRSNPFGRDGSGGLAPINSATGIYVAYATAPHRIAQDGEGKNGLFTSYLVKYINKAGLKIEDVFKKVREDVQRDSNGKQIPWSASSIIGDFYFSASKGSSSINISNNKQDALLPPSTIRLRKKLKDISNAKMTIKELKQILRIGKNLGVYPINAGIYVRYANKNLVKYKLVKIKKEKFMVFTEEGENIYNLLIHEFKEHLKYNKYTNPHITFYSKEISSIYDSTNLAFNGFETKDIIHFLSFSGISSCQKNKPKSGSFLTKLIKNRLHVLFIDKNDEFKYCHKLSDMGKDISTQIFSILDKQLDLSL
jgi:hypothetical protein